MVTMRIFNVLFPCTGNSGSLDRLSLQSRLDAIGRKPRGHCVAVAPGFIAAQCVGALLALLAVRYLSRSIS
jgi:hypothetical protein